MKPMIEGTRVKPELAATVGQWEYVCCECFVQVSTGISAVFSYECAACRNSNLRFIHTLEHMTDGRQILVGIECACVLLGDFEIPARAENECKRKESWRIHYRKPGRCVTTIADLIKRGKL